MDTPSNSTGAPMPATRSPETAIDAIDRLHEAQALVDAAWMAAGSIISMPGEAGINALQQVLTHAADALIELECILGEVDKAATGKAVQ